MCYNKDGDFVEKNIITLAYLGDAVYELYIREKLVNKNIYKTNDIQKEAIKYVSSKSQARILNEIIDKNILTSSEMSIVMRGRNYKRSIHPKNTDIITYKLSTGFEALIGYLYDNKEFERLCEILNYIEV